MPFRNHSGGFSGQIEAEANKRKPTPTMSTSGNVKWSTASNWGGTVPTSGEAIAKASGDLNLTVDMTVKLDKLTVAADGSYTTTLKCDAGKKFSATEIEVTSPATLVLDTAADMTIGSVTGNGTVILTGSGTVASEKLPDAVTLRPNGTDAITFTGAPVTGDAQKTIAVDMSEVDALTEPPATVPLFTVGAADTLPELDKLAFTGVDTSKWTVEKTADGKGYVLKCKLADPSLGETIPCDTAEKAAEVAPRVEQNPAAYIKVPPALADAYEDGYRSLFKGMADGVAVRFELKDEVSEEIQAEANANMANVVAGIRAAVLATEEATVELTARPGPFCPVIGGDAVTDRNTLAEATLAKGSTLAIALPKTTAPSQFYRFRISVTAE